MAILGIVSIMVVSVAIAYLMNHDELSQAEELQQTERENKKAVDFIEQQYDLLENEYKKQVQNHDYEAWTVFVEFWERNNQVRIENREIANYELLLNDVVTLQTMISKNFGELDEEESQEIEKIKELSREIKESIFKEKTNQSIQ